MTEPTISSLIFQSCVFPVPPRIFTNKFYPGKIRVNLAVLIRPDVINYFDTRPCHVTVSPFSGSTADYGPLPRQVFLLIALFPITGLGGFVGLSFFFGVAFTSISSIGFLFRMYCCPIAIRL